MQHTICSNTIEDILDSQRAECEKCNQHAGKHRSNNRPFEFVYSEKVGGNIVQMVPKSPRKTSFIHQCGHECELLGPSGCCNCFVKKASMVKLYAHQKPHQITHQMLCSFCR